MLPVGGAIPDLTDLQCVFQCVVSLSFVEAILLIGQYIWRKMKGRIAEGVNSPPTGVSPHPAWSHKLATVFRHDASGAC